MHSKPLGAQIRTEGVELDGTPFDSTGETVDDYRCMVGPEAVPRDTETSHTFPLRGRSYAHITTDRG